MLQCVAPGSSSYLSGCAWKTLALSRLAVALKPVSCSGQCLRLIPAHLERLSSCSRGHFHCTSQAVLDRFGTVPACCLLFSLCTAPSRLHIEVEVMGNVKQVWAGTFNSKLTAPCFRCPHRVASGVYFGEILSHHAFAGSYPDQASLQGGTALHQVKLQRLLLPEVAGV